MAKSKKELAFLRGLIVEEVWTAKFTDLFDEKFEPGKIETFLYLNAGSGNHALGLSEKLHENTLMFAVCETQELPKIAQEKAAAINSDLSFSTSMPLAQSDFVLADVSFIKPCGIDDFLREAAGLTNKKLAFFLPTAGSFGEVFSHLWEAFLDLDLMEKGEEVEKLIASLPTVSGLKQTAKSLGLKKISATTKNEFLDFESGKEFAESPLIEYFLMPRWLEFLTEKEREQVAKKLAQKIDDERNDLSFRCSIKATLITGRKS